MVFSHSRSLDINFKNEQLKSYRKNFLIYSTSDSKVEYNGPVYAD